MAQHIIVTDVLRPAAVANAVMPGSHSRAACIPACQHPANQPPLGDQSHRQGSPVMIFRD